MQALTRPHSMQKSHKEKQHNESKTPVNQLFKTV